MNIREGKVIIRTAQVYDVAKLCKWWASGEVMAHAGFPNGIVTDEIELSKKIVDQNEESLPNNQLVIIELADSFPIGEMNYRRKSNNTFEIGIKICVIEEQSKGYGEIAIRLLISFLKNQMNARKIILDTNLKNVGAQRFYRRIGFRQTKVLKDCWTDQLGSLQGAMFFELELFD